MTKKQLNRLHENMQSKQSKTGSYVTQLNENDCLLGRGAPLVHYVGNVKYRELIQDRGCRYAAATDHRMKSSIAYEIIQLIQQRNGRFLRRAKYPDDVQKFGPWPTSSTVTEAGSQTTVATIPENSTSIDGSTYSYGGVWIPLQPTGSVVVAKIKQSLRECSVDISSAKVGSCVVQESEDKSEAVSSVSKLKTAKEPAASRGKRQNPRHSTSTDGAVENKKNKVDASRKSKAKPKYKRSTKHEVKSTAVESSREVDRQKKMSYHADAATAEKQINQHLDAPNQCQPSTSYQREQLQQFTQVPHQQQQQYEASNMTMIQQQQQQYQQHMLMGMQQRNSRSTNSLPFVALPSQSLIEQQYSNADAALSKNDNKSMDITYDPSMSLQVQQALIYQQQNLQDSTNWALLIEQQQQFVAPQFQQPQQQQFTAPQFQQPQLMLQLQGFQQQHLHPMQNFAPGRTSTSLEQSNNNKNLKMTK